MQNIELDQKAPDGDWIGYQTWLEVAGTNHRTEACDHFLRKAVHAKSLGFDHGCRLARQPDNAHDINAIQVFGTAQGQSWHIGYVPAFAAKDIAESYPMAMPLAARLIRAAKGDSAVFIKFQVLIPSKRWRRSAGWLDQSQPKSGI